MLLSDSESKYWRRTPIENKERAVAGFLVVNDDSDMTHGCGGTLRRSKEFVDSSSRRPRPTIASLFADTRAFSGRVSAFGWAGGFTCLGNKGRRDLVIEVVVVGTDAR